MSQEITAILEPQEKIIWQGVIDRKVLIFYLLMSLLIVTGVSYFLFTQETINYTSNNVSKNIGGPIVGLTFFICGLLLSLSSFVFNFVKAYVITDTRVLVRSGIIGIDFNSIYFTQIRTANVNVSLIDKIFSVGTINIDTGKVETITSGSNNNLRSHTQTAYDKLLHVSNPYEVYRYFQITLTDRQESLYSGRADKENNPRSYIKS